MSEEKRRGKASGIVACDFWTGFKHAAAWKAMPAPLREWLSVLLLATLERSAACCKPEAVAVGKAGGVVCQAASQAAFESLWAGDVA